MTTRHDGGWRQWEGLTGTFTWPLSLRMASVAEIGPGQRVLDVGCGIGDPTLQVAVLVGPHGRVLGIDVAADMLATAGERARELGLTHVEFQAADVVTAELAAGTFDVALGRMSLSYVADVPGALARMRRALVPGGRVAIAGWAPPEANPWLALPTEEVARVRALSAVDPAAPGPFHLSADGALARALLAAGFQTVQQERVTLSLFARDAAELWGMTTELAGPPAAELAPDERDRVQRAVAERLDRFRSGDTLRIPAQAQLAWGRA
jgi:SAM-dependent methyltransferase